LAGEPSIPSVKPSPTTLQEEDKSTISFVSPSPSQEDKSAISFAPPSSSQVDWLSSQVLTSYAGLALVSVKSAAKQAPIKRANLQREAIQLRQRVLADDPVNFEPEALYTNWMWTEQAIQDWKAVLALKQAKP
jgi:hypothetical protein